MVYNDGALGEKALKAVESGELNIMLDRFEKRCRRIDELIQIIPAKLKQIEKGLDFGRKWVKLGRSQCKKKDITIEQEYASAETRDKLAEELKKVDAMVLIYACDKPSTLDRISMFWLPELRRLESRAGDVPHYATVSGD